MLRIAGFSAVAVLAAALLSGAAIAQQKQQVSFKTPAETVKYGLQQNVAVGDVLNHIVRVFETHQLRQQCAHHQRT